LLIVLIIQSSKEIVSTSLSNDYLLIKSVVSMRSNTSRIGKIHERNRERESESKKTLLMVFHQSNEKTKRTTGKEKKRNKEK